MSEKPSELTTKLVVGHKRDGRSVYSKEGDLSVSVAHCAQEFYERHRRNEYLFDLQVRKVR